MTDMSVNTTRHLIADIEKLREHVGVERLLLLEMLARRQGRAKRWAPTARTAAASSWPKVVLPLTVKQSIDTDDFKRPWRDSRCRK